MPFPENKRNTKGLDKHPENINRKGRPRHIKFQLLEYIKNTYGESIPKDQSIKLLEYIETLPNVKLAEFVKDQNLPAIVQAYGRLLLTGDQKDMRRVSAAELIKDRVHGKPKQSVEHSGEIITQLTPKEREDRIRELKKKLNDKR
jgi:hypothetical protein